MERKGFLRRFKGGGRGHISAYQIAGLDFIKGETETPNPETPFLETANETPNAGALNSEPTNVAIRKEPVLESNREVVCRKHLNSGRFENGSCYACYQNRATQKLARRALMG